MTKKIIFEVTSDDPKIWEAVIRNIKNLQKAFGEDLVEVEVVGHSGGIGMLKQNSLDGELKKISSDKIIFSACENTMQSKEIKKDELETVVGTVDSGVAQVVRKQNEGWAYLKADS